MTVTDERWLGKMALTRLVGEMAGIEDDLRQGACLGHDPELFFPSGHLTPPMQEYQRLAAKRICVTCPVRDACLEGALARSEPYGIWGGMTTRERRSLRRITRSA